MRPTRDLSPTLSFWCSKIYIESVYVEIAHVQGNGGYSLNDMEDYCDIILNKQDTFKIRLRASEKLLAENIMRAINYIEHGGDKPNLLPDREYFHYTETLLNEALHVFRIIFEGEKT